LPGRHAYAALEECTRLTAPAARAQAAWETSCSVLRWGASAFLCSAEGRLPQAALPRIPLADALDDGLHGCLSRPLLHA